MGQIGYWVVDDAFGNMTGIVPDRSPVGNDATMEDTGSGGYPYWQAMTSGCPGFTSSPTLGHPGGLFAPDNAAYTVTDFTMLAAVEVSTHAPSEFVGVMAHDTGAGVSRKWIFGTTAGIDPLGPGTISRTAIHISDGSTFTSLYSDQWPEPLVQRGAGIPGGANASGMYLLGIKRSGNTFSFYHKWGVFRVGDGQLVDQNTGDPILTGPDPAAAIGTASSSIQPGEISAVLMVGGPGEQNAFGGIINLSWAVFYDEALADEDILAMMDAGYPTCGTTLVGIEIDANLVTSDEAVYQPTLGSAAVSAECSTFVEHVCLILTADWEFGRQVVPIYRNDLIFVNAAQQPLTFVNVNDEVLSFNATGLMLSKSAVAGVYGHYLGWSARGEAAPFRIETVEMEYQSTREWDTSP